MAIDWAFIASLEGGNRLQGYVPAATTSKSGVTVAAGFDIGQRNKSDLVNLGLSDALRAKLEPYCLLKSQDAVDYLAKNPLTITSAEANSINSAAKSAAVSGLKRKYDRASAIAFDAIASEAQTVIASVEFQYGSIRDKRRKFWNLVIVQDWAGAVAKLRKFGDPYRSRRRAEANYLEALVKREELLQKGAEAVTGALSAHA